ncbi:hypothetical protein [Streptomyces sp. DT117]|uniref:hypothetical protein n=1 Tax=Streptomyces sp. DT117 TaxID=3393422 RepID=UPI003CF4B121
MPAPSKIRDEKEAEEWIIEGKPYAWIVAQYKKKYNVETSISMWANYRRRNGLPRRITRDDDLIPWHVEERHRWRYDLIMLRLEARRRDGAELSPRDAQRLDSWQASVKEAGAVVHYDPDTEAGFFWIPRAEDDTDIIRKPAQKTTKRRRAD